MGLLSLLFLQSLQKANKGKKSNKDTETSEEASSEPTLSARQKAALESKREEMENLLQEAIKAEDISMLRVSMLFRCNFPCT